MSMEKDANRRLWAIFFLAPGLTGLLIFTIAPILSSLVLTLYHWDLLSAPEWVFLGNFRRLFSDPGFYATLGHTLAFIGGYVPSVLVLGFFLSLLMNREMRGRAWFRISFFIPVISSWIAVALLWSWLFNPKYGLVNFLLGFIGITGPAWLFDPDWAMTAVIITSVWKDLGFVMMIFLAGLQEISPTYYEAASIDGASRFKRLIFITIPLISPTTFFILVISLINSFQVFDQVWVMTGGGPAGATSVLVEQIYRNATSYNRMGYAAAISWVLFALVFLVTIAQMCLQKKWVRYA